MSNVNEWDPGSLAMKGKQGSVVPSGWTVEPKMDGHRVLVHIGSRGKTRLYTGGGREKTHLVPHIIKAAPSYFPSGTWIDGEACAHGGSTEGWSVAQSVLGSSSLHPRHRELDLVVFDVLAFDKHDIRRQDLRERQKHLDRLDATDLQAILRPTVVLPGTDESIREIVNVGYEGAMIKDPASFYASGKRSSSWIKYKVQITGDAVVLDYVPGGASFSGMIGSIVFGQYTSKGVLEEMGRCSGMDMATRQDITAHQKKYVGRPFEFAYNGRMPSGGYRHPQFKRWRDDKKPEECTE